jgi:hypothetical protein
LGFKVDRTEIVKTGVQSGAVVEGFDVVEDGSARPGVGGEAMMVDELIFEATPEGLGKDKRGQSSLLTQVGGFD